MEIEVRILSIICFVIIGISHLLQPGVWISFFKFLISKHYVGAFLNGFISLPIGVLIVSFHNVWTGIPLMLTLMGWCYILKSVICFALPAISLKTMRKVEKDIKWQMQLAGGILIVIAGILSTTVL